MQTQRQHPWHPFRHPGFCGLRGSLCCLFLLSLIIVLPIIFLFEPRQGTPQNGTHTPPTLVNRSKRYVVTHHNHTWWTPHLAPHYYATNSWWKYANYTAKINNQTNCYVCSLLPGSTSHPKLESSPLDGLELYCAAALATGEGDTEHWCASMTLQWNKTLTRRKDRNPSTVSIIVPTRVRFPICFSQNSSSNDNEVLVGRLSTSHCLIVIAHTDQFGYKINTDCNTTYFLYNSCINTSNVTQCNKTEIEALNLYLSGTDKTLCMGAGSNRSKCLVDYFNSTYYCSKFKDPAVDPNQCLTPPCFPSATKWSNFPQKNGTWSVGDVWWICGHNALSSLPANWTGVCALGKVTDHTVILSASNVTNQAITGKRHKRETQDSSRGKFQQHDSKFGSDVPTAFKHWTTSEKVLMSLFPFVGTAKNTLRLETIDYRFKSFVNSSAAALGGIKSELRSLRLMTMQNRMALDLIAAPQGGVCAMVGEYCCTYIPENDADGHIIDTALKNITALRDAMAKDGFPSPDWLTSLFTSWRGTLIQIGIVLLAIILFISCVIPFLHSLIQRLITSTMLRYTAIARTDNFEENTSIRPTTFVHTPHSSSEDSSDEDTFV